MPYVLYEFMNPRSLSLIMPVIIISSFLASISISSVHPEYEIFDLVAG